MLLDGDSIGKSYDVTVPIVANSEAVVSQLLSGIGAQDDDKGKANLDEISQLKEQTYRV